MRKLIIFTFFLTIFSFTESFAVPWVAKHNLSSSRYQSLFNSYIKMGYRLSCVNGYSIGKTTKFAAIWEKRSGPAWIARHNLSSSSYQKAFNEFTKKGYRLTHVSGYSVNGKASFAAIWEKKSGPAWIARHNLSSSSYQKAFNEFTKKGYRLTHVSGYSVNGEALFAAIWEKKSGPAWIARHNLSSSSYQKTFNEYDKKGYSLVHVSGYRTSKGTQYVAIWEKKPKIYIARHGLTSSEYQTAFDNYNYRGYKLEKVSAFNFGNEARFAAIWRKVGGMKNSDIKHIDNKVNAFMKKYDIPGLSIAIAKDGKLLYTQGFGYADKDKKRSTNPKDLFRIASVSKPITSVAIMKLVEEGKLSLSDKVFGNNGILKNDYGKQPYGSGITSITVQHLLEHTAGGWSNSSNDPMFAKTSLSQKELIDWVLNERSLDTTPGSNHAYSNFGYCVLGRVIEKITGMSYENYVKNNILKKCGVTDMHIAGDKESDRRHNEVIYYGDNPYGMKVARMDAHGGWISSAIDLLRFMIRVDGFSTKKDILKYSTIKTMTTGSSAKPSYAKGWTVNSSQWSHNGSLPGSGSLLVRDKNGYCFSIVTNYRCNKGCNFYSDLAKLPKEIINGIGTYSNIDFF